MDDALEPVTGTAERIPRDIPVPAPAAKAAGAAAGGPPVVVGPPAAAPAPADGDDGAVMTLVDHLSELRHRLFKCILAIAVGAVLGWMLAPQIITLLAQPVPNPSGGADKLQFLTVSGAFLNWTKIALVVGILVALPVILYQLWAFVAPGLTDEEKRLALPWVPLAMIFFVMGVVVSWVTLPFALQFLTGFTVEGVTETRLTGEAYFGFVTTMFIIFGAVMEFPIVLVLLHKLGVLSVEKLRSSRRMVILGITIFSVVVTPGGDPFSPVVMAGVMYALFEFTIFMLARSEQTKARSAAKATAAAQAEAAAAAQAEAAAAAQTAAQAEAADQDGDAPGG